MDNSRQNRKESIGSQRVDHFVNLEWRRDREHNRTPSARVETEHTEHTNESQSRTGNHVPYEQETRNRFGRSLHA